MNISNELKIKIEKIIKNDENLKGRLLYGDIDTIREIGIMSQKGISPKEIVESYENNTIDKLYKHSLRMLELQKLYKELCEEYYLQSDMELKNKIR